MTAIYCPEHQTGKGICCDLLYDSDIDFQWCLILWPYMKLILFFTLFRALWKLSKLYFRNLQCSVQTFFGVALSPISLFHTNSSKNLASTKFLSHVINSGFAPPPPPPPPLPACFPDLVICGMRAKQKQTTIQCGIGSIKFHLHHPSHLWKEGGGRDLNQQ